MYGPGVQLGGRYRLAERIGGGGMGEVWRGTDEVLGRTVAVKIMLPALLDEPGFVERFRGEALTMANLKHPGVVDVYDYRSDVTVAFLVMEYVDGDALSRTLSRVGRLTAPRTMALVAQAADALQAAHDKGIVHRDVKPGNLMVRADGTLVLTDFGIARSELVGVLTATGAVLGTASYLSPEQAAGQVATPASDVYALGVVAHQCLAGRRPFEGENPVEIAMKHLGEAPPPLPPDIPATVKELVIRTLAKNPAQRWPSASSLGAVARQAAAATAGFGVAGIPAGPPVSPAAVPPAVHPVSPAGDPPDTEVAPPRPPMPQPGGFHHGLAAVGTQRALGTVPAPSRPAPPRQVTDGPSGVFIVGVILAALAILLCAGLGGYVARQLVNDQPLSSIFPLITYDRHIEGSTIT